MNTRTIVALCCLLAACQGVADAPPAVAGPFEWTLGSWQGVRRDGRDAPMKVRVESVLGGTAQIEHLEIELEDSVYRGFSVQLFDAGLGRHVRQYANSTRGRFVRLEGEVEGSRSVWRTVAPDRTRDSQLVSERLGMDRWRRAMSISEDGGKTWRVLWTDELRRIGRR